MEYLFLALAGYVVGSFPTGVVLSKYKYRIDVREIGSGNIGATNITRVFGWWAGVVTLSIDFLKGFVPAMFVQYFYPDSPWLLTLTAVSLVVGHCYSLFLKFSGGKGVATSLGAVSVVAPVFAGIAVLVYLALLVLTKISAIGSLSGVVLAIGYVFLWQPPLPISVLILALIVVVLTRHWSNIQRLIRTWKQRKGGP